MSSTPAGWYPDPYGRYERRYWDGTTWTARVSTGNEQRDDPLGTSLAIPFAIPKTATGEGAPQGFAAVPEPEGEGGASGTIPFLERMGPEAKRRPDPEAGLALAGIGGAVLAEGLFALIADAGTEGRMRGRLLIFAVIVFGVALAVRLMLPAQRYLRSAAVGAGVLGLGGLLGGILWTQSDHSWALLIYGLAFIAAWALPGFYARPLFLGIGVLSLVVALGIATAGSGRGLSGNGDFRTNGAGQAAVFLVAAIVLLGLVFVLDRRGYHGTATALVIPALLSTAIGVGDTLVQIDDATGSSLLIIAAGVVICLVGGYGERRATTWIGAAVTAIGVVAFWVATIKPDSTSSVSTTMLLGAAVLIVAPIVVELVKHNRSREQAPPAPAYFDPPRV